MPVKTHCKSCGSVIVAPTDMRGETVRCPRCKEPNFVPADAKPSERKNPWRRKSYLLLWTVWLPLITIIIVVVMLLPAPRGQRIPPRWVYSKSHLQQIGLGLHNYDDAFHTFPPGGVFDQSGKGHHSWMAMILPHMEEKPIWEAINFKHSWDAGTNTSAMYSRIKVFLSPSQIAETDERGFALSHYSANERILTPNGHFPRTKCIDGEATTILAGEVWSGFKPWGDPSNVRDPAAGINIGPEGFGRLRPSGALFLFVDGSVRLLRSDTDPAILQALATPDGGETIPPNAVRDAGSR